MEGIDGATYVKVAAVLGAAFVMGIGSIGPALGQGFIGEQTLKSIGKYPENIGNIRMTMFLAMGMVETSALYCLLIAFLLIFAV